jgi:hypothetical protein
MAHGANQLIPELIGEAFIDAVRNSRHSAARRVRALWDHLRRVAGAPPESYMNADGFGFRTVEDSFD